jgi:hypothetical protein
VTRPVNERVHGEDGTVTAFVVVFAAALILFAGLVIDGGLTLAARVQAINEAQAAARAGAQAIDLVTYRATGELTLNHEEARQAALAYLAQTGHEGTVEIRGNEVDVSVRITQPMQILGVGGIAQLTVEGRGSARPEHGVQAPEP